MGLQMLAKESPGGWWEGEQSLYQPEDLSSNWLLLVLSDLEVTKGRFANTKGL